MMQPKAALLRQAKAKAAEAYGDSIDADLRAAVTQMLTRDGWLGRCMQTMQMTSPPALLRQRIKNLLPKS